MNGDWDKASGSGSMPAGVRAWIRRGIILGVAAILVLTGVFGVYPAIRNKRIGRLMARAELLHERGNAEAALGLYKRVAADYPRTRQGSEASRKAAELEPYVAEAARRGGVADKALKNQEYEEAWRLYRELARDFAQSRRGVSAKSSIPHAARLACQAHGAKAREAEAAWQWDKARSLYARMKTIDAGYEGVLEGLKRTTEKWNSYRNAMAMAERCCGKRDWEEARARYEEARRIIPDSAEAAAGRTSALQHIPPPEGMILLAPGKFVVGCDEEGDADERPRRELFQDGVYMDRTEVTNEAYGRFVAATGYMPPTHWKGSVPPQEIAGRPVVCVSWHGAAAYAKWAGKRLPTAAEWERAARGRSGRVYPWGDDFSPDKGVYAGGAEPAGSARGDRSLEGCMDMSGNVCEWTATEDKEGCRVICGGSWAGFEGGRAARVVADDVAAVESDPARTVAVDHPEVWGMTVRGFSEVKFFLTGAANGVPAFEVRKYVPDLDRYVGRTFVVGKGGAIRGEGPVRMGPRRGPGGRREGQRTIVFETGCRVVEVIRMGGPTHVDAIVEDAKGRRFRMRRERPTDEKPPGGHVTEARAAVFDGALAMLRGRSLRRVMRSANRRRAPAEARFINCGFRCAKDIPQAKVGKAGPGGE